jgi:DNA-binding response OmpR family regulator
MRILVVDDDRQLCAIIKRGLLEEAYAVDLAYDGDEVELDNNPLSSDSINIYISELKARGINVYH